MKFSKLYTVLIVLISVFQIADCHVFDEPFSVIELTEAELIKMMKNQEPTVIMGHMKHCSHCTNQIKALKSFAKKYPQIHFFMVNGPEKKFHKKIADQSKFSIPGYPSTIFIKHAKIENVQIGGNEKTLEENIKKLLK